MGKIRFLKDKWFIIFLSLAIIFAGTGYYLKTGPEWTKNTYHDYYNQGVADYLKKRFNEAQNKFYYVFLKSNNPELEALALYNWGTMIGEWVFDERLSAAVRFQYAEIAIDNLREAVWLNPENEDAKYNLELLRNKQRELFMEIQKEMGDGEPEQGEPGYSPGKKDTGF